jgi:release factor glutamine methyltransferase
MNIVQAALNQGAQLLSRHAQEAVRISAARLDAQILLAHILGVDRSALYAHPDRVLTPEQEQQYLALLERRAGGEPVAYLTGHKEFYGLDLLVDRRVLIPRPETELLVEAALRVCREKLETGRVPIVADIGTGSGAIPIAIAVNEPRLPYLYASDISADALAVAGLNSRRHHVEGRIRLLHGDLDAPLPEPVDVLTANLPYIASGEMEQMQDDVLLYEPHQALFSGTDGLVHIERLFTNLAHSSTLSPGAVLLLEIGYAQRDTLAHLLETLWPLARVIFIRDYAGWDRVVEVSL